MCLQISTKSRGGELLLCTDPFPMEGSFVIAFKKKNTGGIKMKAHDLMKEVESALKDLAKYD